MNRTNTAVLYLRASRLIQLAGRIHENELWVRDACKRKLLDEHIEEALRDIADWAGFDLIKREKTQEAA